MHHATIAIAAILSAAVLTSLGASELPQHQAFAHHGHYRHHNNTIPVNQDVNQLDNCTSDVAQCANNANNQLDLPR
jgi:hypothetical protein